MEEAEAAHILEVADLVSVRILVAADLAAAAISVAEHGSAGARGISVAALVSAVAAGRVFTREGRASPRPGRVRP